MGSTILFILTAYLTTPSVAMFRTVKQLSWNKPVFTVSLHSRYKLGFKRNGRTV